MHSLEILFVSLKFCLSSFTTFILAQQATDSNQSSTKTNSIICPDCDGNGK